MDVSPPLPELCRTEIEALHSFFVEWFRGALPHEDRDFRRVTAALSPDFCLITPDGTLHEREALLASLKQAHGSRPQGFEIWVERFDCRIEFEASCLVTYEEWQTLDGETRARRSSALLERAPDAPGGVTWRHVHEVWMTPPP